MPRHKSKPLTPEQREAVWDLYINKRLTMKSIASTFDISISVIHRVVHQEQARRQLAY